MKSVSMAELERMFPPLTPDPEDGSYLDHTAVQMVDWKDRPNEVLEAVDRQLRVFGLEVVEANFNGDAHVWFIAPYESPPVYFTRRREAVEDELTKNQQRILNYVAAHPQQTEDEILKGVFPNSLHDRSSTVNSALSHLVEKGIIKDQYFKE